jgi:hypothetical protein
MMDGNCSEVLVSSNERQERAVITFCRIGRGKRMTSGYFHPSKLGRVIDSSWWNMIPILNSFRDLMTERFFKDSSSSHVKLDIKVTTCRFSMIPRSMFGADDESG